MTLGGITSHIHFQNIYEYWIANRGSDNVGFIRGVNDDLPEDFLNGETPGQMVYGIEMVSCYQVFCMVPSIVDACLFR